MSHVVPDGGDVAELAAGHGLFAVEVDLGAFDGEGLGEVISRIDELESAHHVDGDDGRGGCPGGPEREVEDGTNVVFELGGGGALDGPVSGVVGPGSELVDDQPVRGEEQFNGEDADGFQLVGESERKFPGLGGDVVAHRGRSAGSP